MPISKKQKTKKPTNRINKIPFSAKVGYNLLNHEFGFSSTHFL